MIARKLIAVALFAALSGGAAYAQATQPATTTPAKPSTTAPAAAPAAKAAAPAAAPAAKTAAPAAAPAAKAAAPAAPPATKAAAPAPAGAPAATPAAKPAAAAPAPKAAAPVAATGKKVNLNSATAEDLDKLPQIGPARAKAIIDARAKGKFKSWDDFVARNVVPANAEKAIKDLVGF